MATLTVYSTSKQKVGEVAIPEGWAKARISQGLVFNAVQALQTNRRQGTVKTKHQDEVKGSDKKPFRQKGTGRARQGSACSALMVGGGQTFGPRPRVYHDRLSPVQRRKALLQALLAKYREGKVVVLDRWECNVPKTRDAAKTLNQLGLTNALIVLDAPQDALARSLRNIPRVGVEQARAVNVLDLLRYDTVVFTQAAFEQVKGRVGA